MQQTMSQNIFNYATSELSQDAFISLLIAWFDSKDTNLKKLSIDFINALYNAYFEDSRILEIDTVKLIQQHFKIDVYFEVTEKDGNRIPFIIEDKTWTEPHSKQLSRYIGVISKKFPTKDIVKIFFKTGHITEKDINETIESNYTIINSKWIYDFLNNFNTNNIIFHDYRNYLKREFFTKLYHENGTSKQLKDWTYIDVKEGYVQYAIMEKIKKSLQNNKEITTNKYIKFIKNGKLWDTWWSFNLSEDRNYSLFVKIKRISGNYRIRLIKYSNSGFNSNTKKEKLNKYAKYLDEILRSKKYIPIQKTSKPRHKARETEIAFLELDKTINLEDASNKFSEFLDLFIKKVENNNLKIC